LQTPEATGIWGSLSIQQHRSLVPSCIHPRPTETSVEVPGSNTFLFFKQNWILEAWWCSDTLSRPGDKVPGLTISCKASLVAFATRELQHRAGSCWDYPWTKPTAHSQAQYDARKTTDQKMSRWISFSYERLQKKLNKEKQGAKRQVLPVLKKRCRSCPAVQLLKA